MADFQLFRIKVVRRPQANLFDPRLPASELLRKLVFARPAANLGWRRVRWQIGNVAEVDRDSAYFLFGRVTRTTLSVYDASRADFIDSDVETAPHTDVVIDFALEVCAIASKTQLSAQTIGLARRLANLLNESPLVKDTAVEIEIVGINDPEDFLQQIRNAYTVTRFGITFSRPNPFDVNRDFQAPLERFAAASEARRGRASVNGQSLKKDVLEDLTRSAAASGEDAQATLRQDSRSKPVRRSLHGHAATFAVDETVQPVEPIRLIEIVRLTYERIRRRNG